MGIFSRRSNNNNAVAADVSLNSIDSTSSTAGFATNGKSKDFAPISSTGTHSSMTQGTSTELHDNSANISPPIPLAKPSLKKKLSDTNLVSSIFSLKGKKSSANIKNDATNTRNDFTSNSNSSSTRSSYNNYHSPSDSDPKGITVISVSDIVKPVSSPEYDDNNQNEFVAPRLKKKSSFLKNPFHNNNNGATENNNNNPNLSRTPSNSSLKKKISISNIINVHKSSSKSNLYPNSNNTSNKASTKYLQNQTLDISAPSSNIPEDTPKSPLQKPSINNTNENSDEDDFGNEIATPYVPANESFNIKNSVAQAEGKSNPITSTPIFSNKMNSSEILDKVHLNTNLMNYSVNSENDIFLSPQIISPSKTIQNNSDNTINPDSSSRDCIDEDIFTQTTQDRLGKPSLDIPGNTDEFFNGKNDEMKLPPNTNYSDGSSSMQGIAKHDDPQIVSPTEYILQSSPIETSFTSKNNKAGIPNVMERVRPTANTPDSGNRFSTATVDSFYFRSSGTTPVEIQQNSPLGENTTNKSNSGVVKSPLSNNISLDQNIQDSICEPVKMVEQHDDSYVNRSTVSSIQMSSIASNDKSNEINCQPRLLPPIDNNITGTSINMKHADEYEDDEFPGNSSASGNNTEFSKSQSTAKVSGSQKTDSKFAATPKNSAGNSFENSNSQSRSFSKSKHPKSPSNSAKRYSKLVTSLLTSSSSTNTSPSMEQHSSSAIKKVVPAFISSHFKSSNNSNHNTPEKQSNGNSANSSNARYLYSGPLSATSKVEGSGESGFHLLRYSGSRKQGSADTNTSNSNTNNNIDHIHDKSLSPIPLVTTPFKNSFQETEISGDMQPFGFLNNALHTTKNDTKIKVESKNEQEKNKSSFSNNNVSSNEEKSKKIDDDDEESIVNQRKHTNRLTKRISSLYYSSSKKNKKQLTIINISSPPLLDSSHHSSVNQKTNSSDIDESSDDSSISDNDLGSISASFEAATNDEEIAEIMEASSIITAKRVTQSPKEVTFNNVESSKRTPAIPKDNLQIYNKVVSSSGTTNGGKKRLIAERVKIEEPQNILRVDTDLSNSVNNKCNSNFSNGAAPHTLLSPIVEVDTPQNKSAPSILSLPLSRKVSHNLDSAMMDAKSPVLQPPSSEFISGRIVNNSIDRTKMDYNEIPVSTPVNETIFISPTESNYSNFLITPVSERARSYSSDYEEASEGIRNGENIDVSDSGSGMLNLRNETGHERSTSKANIMNRLINNNDSTEMVTSQNNNELSVPYSSYKDDFTSPSHVRSSSMASSISLRSRHHTRANSGNFKTPKMVSSNLEFSNDDDVIDQTPIIHDYFKNSSQITLNHENSSTVPASNSSPATKSPLKEGIQQTAIEHNKPEKALKIQIFKHKIAEKSPNIPNTFTVDNSEKDSVLSDIKSPISPSILTYEALANNGMNSKPYDGALHSSNSSIDDVNSMTSLSPSSSKFETPRGDPSGLGNPYANHNNNSVLSHRHQSSSRLPIASTPIEMSKDPIFAKILKNGNNNESSEEMPELKIEKSMLVESPNKTFQQYDRLAEDYDSTLSGSHGNVSSLSKLRQSNASVLSSFSTVNPFLEKNKSPEKSKVRRQNSQTLRALNGLGSSPEKPQSNTGNRSPGGDSTFSTAKSFVSASSSPINRNSIADGQRNTGSGSHHHHSHSKQLSNSTSDSVYDSIYRSSSLKSVSQQSLIKKSPSIASSLDFHNRHRSRRFSLGIHETSGKNLETVKDTDIAEEYVSMFVKASHSFDSATLKNTDDSSICLSFKKGDNAFVYNVDSSGWAEVVLFNKEFTKGWVPINFFKKCIDESVPFTNNIEDIIASKRYLKPLLVASGEFLSIDPSEISRKSNNMTVNEILTIGAYRDYINNIRDGVRLLLEYTNTITRTNAVVRKRPALRKVRKSLLAEWYQLFSYVDHHSNDMATDVLLEFLQKMNLKIISRAHIFLLIWAKESTVYENEMTANKKNMISKRKQNRKIHQETVFYLSEHPNALDRFSQVKSLLYRYLLLILGRIDIIENNFYACEQLESVTHQIILLMRELLFVSKSATRLLHNDVSLYINNSYDDILSSLSDLVSGVKRMVTKTEHDEQKLLVNEEDSDIQIEDDIDTKEFQYSKEGNKILRVAANTLDHISKVVKSCEKLLNTTGNFQLTASRKYPDFERMNISNNEFIKCGLDQLIHNQIVVYKVTKHGTNWEPYLPVGASCKYAYIRGDSRSLTYSGGKLIQIYLKGEDIDYDIPLNNKEYDANYCMNNIISQIAYDDGSSNSTQYGNTTNFNNFGKIGSKHSSMISINNSHKKNQNVLGGSFKALVYLLTNERNFPSDFFITTFLLSFRNFSNSRKLVYELIKRFDVGDRERQFLISNNALGYPDYNSFDSLMKKRRRNVLTVIQIWLESYFERDSDFVIIPIILNFINDAVIEYLPQEGYKLCEICCKLIMRHSRRNQEFIDIQLNPKRIGLVKTNFENSNINSTSSSLNLLSPSTSENDMSSLHSAASSSISISLSLSGSISNYSITSFRSKNQEFILEKLIGEFKSILQTEWFIGNSPLSLTKMIDSWFEICSKDLNLEVPSFYNELLQHNTVEIAKQLTDIESKIFLGIQPNELLDENFREKRIHLQKSRTIEKSVLFTNLLSDLVSDSIVLPGFTIKTRVNHLKQWIKIGLACYQLRNFNSLAAIITILQSAAISRLDKLWANLSSKYAETFDYLCKIVNPYKNYKVYRYFIKPYFQSQEDKKSQLPLVPYINLFLQDIIFATDGNRNKRRLMINGEEQSLINFDKYSKIVDCIARLQHLQIEYQYSSNGSNFENLNNSKASIFSLSKNAEGEYIENENEMNDVLVVNKQLEEFILLMLWGTRQKNLKDSDRFWKHSLEIQPGK